MTYEPMLARAATGLQPIEKLVGTHVFDLKVDGLRALVTYDGEQVKITSRTGVDMTRQFPELHDLDLPYPVVLDGEIVAQSNSFEVTNTRAKQQSGSAIKHGATTSPCAFLAFDVLEIGEGRSLVEWTWEMRRQVLDELELNGSYARTVYSRTLQFVGAVREQGMEGVIAKRITSTYQQGRRSQDWLKYKNLHRVSCIAAGYATGTGSRAAFGAVHLALHDDKELVSVGRVGAGFSNKQIAQVKALIDAKQVVVVEVECLGVTTGNQLRQPVFKGVRTDKTWRACTTAQLDDIPKS